MRTLVIAAAILAMALPATALQDGGGEKKPAPQPAALKPEEIEKKVVETLDSFRGENSYSPDNARVRTIINLGRKAVEPILRHLRKLHQADEGHPFLVKAASDALAGLVTPEDVPAVAALLEEGLTEAAHSLRDLKKEAVRGALLAPLAKGWCSSELVGELQRFRGDAEARKALLAYLEKHGRSGDYSTAEVAEWLGQAGVKEALPPLRKILDAGEGAMDGRWKVAAAVVALGDKAGIVALKDIFSAGGGSFHDFDRHSAGEALNRVLGERVYVGTYGTGSDKGNFDEAAKKFAAWWEKAKDRIRYDEKASRWAWD